MKKPMKKEKALLMLSFMLLVMFVLGTFTTNAGVLEGVNADKVKVKVYTKQGDDWFRARYVKTDSDGVLKLENALPGKYEAVVRDSDQRSTQVIAAEFKMLDDNGAPIDEETDVRVYMYLNGTKTFLGTWQTSKNGTLRLTALYPDTRYELSISDEMDVDSRSDRYRIKVKSKIDESSWFQCMHTTTDKQKELEVTDVLPGYYKFKYTGDDATAADTFTLKAQLRNDDAESIDEETAVNVYAYIGKMKTLVGTVMTDDEGWVTLPGVMTGMKYKIEIK